jgi:hypothetical protein
MAQSIWTLTPLEELKKWNDLDSDLPQIGVCVDWRIMQKEVKIISLLNSVISNSFWKTQKN